MQTQSIPTRRNLEFGIYRDGDNNLDASQSIALAQALKTSASDSHIQFTVQDTTGLRVSHGDVTEGKMRTDTFTIQDGQIGQASIGKPHTMSDPKNLAQFVAHTLDNAEATGAKQTWIDLVDHGGGDGGGLETHTGAVMSMPDIAKAIADGVALHGQEHPEDAHRGIDGVVANQCLMSTLGFSDALSRVGVKYLAASPETMVSPGVPSGVAHAIASNESDPKAMASAVVRDVMQTHYGYGSGPAAAFDVLDTTHSSVAKADAAIKRFNDAASASDASSRNALKADVASVQGMVRFSEATPDMPWNADRPAIALYNAIASDRKLDSTLRDDAHNAAKAVGNLVLAHSESTSFKPFDGSDYQDAVGPTIHAPVSAAQVDPWAPKISETHNAFYKAVDQGSFVRAIA